MSASTPGVKAEGLRMLGHSTLDGHGNGMQAMIRGNHLFVGRMEPGLPMLVVDVSDPRHPEVVASLPVFPDTWHTKCQSFGDLLLVNYEQRRDTNLNPAGRNGYAVYDISNPRKPRELCYRSTGGRGIHRMWWAGERYAYLSGKIAGFRQQVLLVVDMSDPGQPREVSRWWLPGMKDDEPQPIADGLKVMLHHGIHHGGRLYCGLWDGGCAILDVTDPSRVREVSRLSWAPEEGSCTHTALPLPGRKLLAVVDESTKEGGAEPPKYLRVLDIADETSPRVVSRWALPDTGYSAKGGRFGPHNLHENRPDTFRSEHLLFVTYFNAGLRVIDISRPEAPVEVGYFIPPDHDGSVVQSNDVVVAQDGRIFVTDRAGAGLYILERA